MIQELFAKCLTLPAEQWEGVLLQRCPEDATVRQQVLDLLVADAENQASGFLNEPWQTDATHPSQAEPPPFQQLGEYQIIRQIGHGSFGVVYLARRRSFSDLLAASELESPPADVETKHLFAIKVLHPWLRDKRSLGRFAAEAQALRFLDDPHVATFVEAGSDGEVRYLVMEYVDGRGMNEYLRTSKGDYNVSLVPLPTRIEWFRMVCQGVAAAHQRLILHRDLKPSNVLIDDAGKAIVTDFGLAKFLDPDHQAASGVLASMTGTGQSPGTLLFMAPEQMDGSGELCLATDVYGLGATLYFLLTGRPPYAGRSSVELCRAIRLGPPAAIARDDLNVSKDLEAICFKCLCAEPRRRYQTAQALGDDISRYQAGEPISARRIGRLETTTYWIRRNPVTSLLATGWLVSISVGLAVALFLWMKAERNFDVAQASRTDLLETIKEVTGHLKIVEADPKTLALQREMLLSIAKGYDRLATYSELEPRQANNRGVAWFKLGRVENQLGDLQAKMMAYSNAEKVFRSQVELDPTNVEWLFDHFHAHTSLGRSEDALIAIEKVVAFDKSGNADYQNAYSNALLELALKKLTEDEVSQAVSLAQRGFEIAMQLNNRFPNDNRFLRKLAQHYFLQYEIAVRHRDLEQMIDHLKSANDLIRQSHQLDVTDAGVRIEVIKYSNSMALLHSMLGNESEAAQYFDIADQASEQFYRDFPTFIDAWGCRAVVLLRRVAFFHVFGDETASALAKKQFEDFVDARMSEKSHCYIANTFLALYVANPTLRASPDFLRARELIRVARQDPLVRPLDNAEQVLNLWQGEVEKVTPSAPAYPLFKHYLQAIEVANFQPPADPDRFPPAVDKHMLFDFLTYDPSLIPHGFYRDVTFARGQRMARDAGKKVNSP